MNLTLERVIFTPRTTAGVLLVDGQFQCFTLEDVVRPLGTKVYGKTAVPYGSYDIIMRWSPSKNMVMPYLQDVPMFQDVMLHVGNDEDDTLGCILVGQKICQDRIEDSRLAFEALLPKITTVAQRGERMVLNIYSDPPDYHLL